MKDLFFSAFYLDEAYRNAVATPYRAVSRFLWLKVDEGAVDGGIDGRGMVFLHLPGPAAMGHGQAFHLSQDALSGIHGPIGGHGSGLVAMVGGGQTRPYLRHCRLTLGTPGAPNSRHYSCSPGFR